MTELNFKKRIFQETYMFLRLHTLYISTILILKLMFLSFVKNKFSLPNYIMAILVTETVAKRIYSPFSE